MLPPLIPPPGLDAEMRGLWFAKNDLRLFSEEHLQILDKLGNKSPFRWNRAQHYIHERLEEQLRTKGYIRALILKGRQQGCSTYVAARFYHKCSLNFGRRAFIVSHEDKSTANLFSMVKRYHTHNSLAPSTQYSNAQELVFGVLDAGYKLATAGSDDVGRGNTAQLLHASEFGFWRNAAMHLAGIGNSIALAPGTEIIMESTANGIGNQFHGMWQEAEAGNGEYIAIFVPWFWQEEYRLPVPETGFTPSDEERRYQKAYGLDDGQMVWRRAKIAEYGKGMEWLFDQEYPATAALAFQTSTRNPLINPHDVSLAVNNLGFAETSGAFVIGCDPAEEGDDRTSMAHRWGRTCFRVEYHEKKRPMEVAGMLAKHWVEGVPFRGRNVLPDAIIVDRTGIGAGIYDRLLELNIPAIGVHSGSKAADSEAYENKRAEMWWRMKKWIEDNPNRLPNDSALISDLSAPQPKQSSSGKNMVEKKADMKKRGIRSPDGGDALALTFAEFPAAIRSGGHLAADGLPGAGQQVAATAAGY